MIQPMNGSGGKDYGADPESSKGLGPLKGWPTGKIKGLAKIVVPKTAEKGRDKIKGIKNDKTKSKIDDENRPKDD